MPWPMFCGLSPEKLKTTAVAPGPMLSNGAVPSAVSPARFRMRRVYALELLTLSTWPPARLRLSTWRVLPVFAPLLPTLILANWAEGLTTMLPAKATRPLLPVPLLSRLSMPELPSVAVVPA